MTATPVKSPSAKVPEAGFPALIVSTAFRWLAVKSGQRSGFVLGWSNQQHGAVSIMGPASSALPTIEVGAETGSGGRGANPAMTEDDETDND